jgi:choline monooxygenase
MTGLITRGTGVASPGQVAAFELEADEASAIKAGLAEGSTLPLWWYDDAAVAAAEQRRIFQQSWHYVGHVGRVSSPGSFFTCEVAGVPIVVTRDEDGNLGAFHNVCRHRGAIVVREEEGQRKRLQCHYHAWTYGLDGQLRAAPRSDREACFVKENLGLRRGTAATWGPFVFVHLQHDAPPLAEALGTLPSLVAATGVDVDELRHHVRVDYDLDCDWKVAIENYLECYHCPNAHPGFSDVLDTRMEAYQLELEPGFAWQNGPLKPQSPAVAQSTGYTGRDGAVPEGRYFALWPNIKININPGLSNLSIGPMIPTGPGRCHGVLDYYFGPDVSDSWIKDMFEFDDQVGREDRVLVESVQRGLRSRTLDTGRVMIASERLISGFQHYVVDALATPQDHG